MRRFLVGLILLSLLSACGTAASPTATPAPATSSADLSGIKQYLTAKTAELEQDTAALQRLSQQYYDLAAASQFDYAVLWQEQAAAVQPLLTQARETWKTASPRYEQMEGIVAGVDELAQFDVDLDAGSAASADSENAVSFNLQLADGRELQQPGNLFGITESTLWGTEPAFTGAQIDLDGDGQIEFGEALPEANVLLAASTKLHELSSQLTAAASAWTPTVEQAFSALVVMIPTMNEYFESWKHSRFVAGESSTQRDFVAISRLADIQDILGSLQVVYTGVKPLVSAQSSEQAQQIETQLDSLKTFVAGVHADEQSGKRFSAEEADLLGEEAQNRATAITGQISQVAAQLNVPLSE